MYHSKTMMTTVILYETTLTLTMLLRDFLQNVLSTLYRCIDLVQLLCEVMTARTSLQKFMYNLLSNLTAQKEVRKNGMLAIPRYNATCRRNGSRLNCLFITQATNDEIDHSISYKSGHSAIIETGKWYGLVRVSLTAYVYYRVRGNYFMVPFCTIINEQRIDICRTFFIITGRFN